jgi:hypothetical protein
MQRSGPLAGRFLFKGREFANPIFYLDAQSLFPYIYLTQQRVLVSGLKLQSHPFYEYVGADQAYEMKQAACAREQGHDIALMPPPILACG